MAADSTTCKIIQKNQEANRKNYNLVKIRLRESIKVKRNILKEEVFKCLNILVSPLCLINNSKEFCKLSPLSSKQCSRLNLDSSNPI